MRGEQSREHNTLLEHCVIYALQYANYLPEEADCDCRIVMAIAMVLISISGDHILMIIYYYCLFVIIKMTHDLILPMWLAIEKFTQLQL